MSIIGKIFKKGIIYRTYDFIRSWWQYRKIVDQMGDILYGGDFHMVVAKYLNVELDEDWLGRLYGVINPNVDIRGNLNVNNMIIEIDGDNTNTDEYVKNWLYRQLNLMGRLFNMRNLYSHVNMDIEHVGPEDDDNYLVVFDIVERADMAQAFKRLMRTLFTYLIVGGAALWAYGWFLI